MDAILKFILIFVFIITIVPILGLLSVALGFRSAAKSLQNNSSVKEGYFQWPPSGELSYYGRPSNSLHSVDTLLFSKNLPQEPTKGAIIGPPLTII